MSSLLTFRHVQIRDSIIGPTACSLATFTYHTANKYRRGAFEEDLNFGYTIHNALLVSWLLLQVGLVPLPFTAIESQRRFGLDNLDLIRKQSTLTVTTAAKLPRLTRHDWDHSVNALRVAGSSKVRISGAGWTLGFLSGDSVWSRFDRGTHGESEVLILLQLAPAAE